MFVVCKAYYEYGVEYGRARRSISGEEDEPVPREVGKTREKTRRCKTCSTTQEMMTKMDKNDTHEHINVSDE